MDVIATPSRSCSGRCGSRGYSRCGHDDLHSAGGFKVWRKVTTETTAELQLLCEKWRLLLAGVVFQYIHGLAARGVHYLHRPGPLLQDLGFMALPELGHDKGYLSESIFASIFFSFVLWTFHPFIYHNKRLYTVLIWRRVLAFSRFTGFKDHYILFHPASRSKLSLSRVPRGVLFGCGDLIFSSHMIFYSCFRSNIQQIWLKKISAILVSEESTEAHHAPNWFIKLLAWFMAIIQSLLIIASRKHYTVDVVVAWYTVNLVVFFVDSKLPEMPDRTNGPPLLPLSTREKDSRLKEERDIRLKDEFHKLLNGNHGDPNDRRQRAQMNGRHDEDINHSSHGTLSDATTNGT